MGFIGVFLMKQLKNLQTSFWKKKVYIFDRDQILSFLVKLTPSEDTGSVPNISAHINAILFLKKNGGRRANTVLSKYLGTVRMDDTCELACETP